MKELGVQLVANSGILVETGTLRILIDGIYGENRYFTPPLKEVRKAVFGMNSRYRGLDCLLFTHRHVDHFCAPYADEYAKNNRLGGLYVPRAGLDPDSFLEDRRPLPKAAEKGVLHEIHLEGEETFRAELAEDCALTYFRTEHLDSRSYGAVEHCAILLETAGRRLLFAADASASAENCRRFRALAPLTAVFVTPLFLVDPAGRHLLEELRPAQTVLYHIPFEEDDVTQLRGMVRRQLAADPALTALTEPDQRLSL